MNDRYDAGAAGHGADQYELVGYDEYGRPVYRQVQPQQQTQQPYDGYTQQGYGYDPYATGGQQAQPYDPYGGGDTGQQPQTPSYDPYGTGSHQQQHTGGHSAPYDPYGRTASSGQQPRVAEQTAYIPHQAGPVEEPVTQERGERDYRTEQFAFVEEPDQDSEDVIDWLKFTENRTERREEAKRRARARVVALVVVLALAAAGGVGYLWYAGKLPGVSSSDDKKDTATPTGAQKRDVIVLHLHNTKKGGTSTALLVDNTTTKQGTTVLLPNALALSGDDGSTTTLAKSVDDDGSSGTRDEIDTVLGTEIQGTWRLDTPTSRTSST